MHVRNVAFELSGVLVSRQFSRISHLRLPAPFLLLSSPAVRNAWRLFVEGHRRLFTRWPFPALMACCCVPRCEGLKKRSEIIFVSLSSENGALMLPVDVLQEACTRASVELSPAKCSLSVFYTNLSINGLNAGSAERTVKTADGSKCKHMQLNLHRSVLEFSQTVGQSSAVRADTCPRLCSTRGKELACVQELHQSHFETAVSCQQVPGVSTGPYCRINGCSLSPPCLCQLSQSLLLTSAMPARLL